MKIEGIIWLTNIIEKLIVKHHVENYEVEEVLETKRLCTGSAEV